MAAPRPNNEPPPPPSYLGRANAQIPYTSSTASNNVKRDATRDVYAALGHMRPLQPLSQVSLFQPASAAAAAPAAWAPAGWAPAALAAPVPAAPVPAALAAPAASKKRKGYNNNRNTKNVSTRTKLIGGKHKTRRHKHQKRTRRNKRAKKTCKHRKH